MWSVLNSLTKWVHNKQNIIELVEGNSKITDPQVVANKLNNHFVTAGQRVQDQVGSCNKHYLDYVRYVEEDLLLGNISESSVCWIVSKMKTKFSSGINGLSNGFLKKIINSIKVPLCFVINQSLNTGEFPESMKLAKVNALFKSGKDTCKDNYRPISLLPVMSKVIEKHIYLKVLSHMESNNILFPKQFGYRKDHSTADSCAVMIGEILSSFKEEMYFLSVFVDLRKAFDSVNHSMVINKLNSLGVRGKVADWFSSYLTNRYQQVHYSDSVSEQKKITAGVPQGSLLGVLIFQLHINDLYASLRFTSSILYADDTTIYVYGRNPRALKAKMQSDLNSLSMWLNAKKLKSNIDKTKCVLFSKSENT